MTTPTPDASGLPPFEVYASNFRTPSEWADDEGVIELPDALVGVGHVAEDLDMVDEALTYHRHQATESADVTELHAIQSDVNLARAYVLQAQTALTAYLAVHGG